MSDDTTKRNNGESQPVTVFLVDQLRAGLLDDKPELKAAARAALLEDKELAAEDKRWGELCEYLEHTKDDATRLSNRLRLQRRRVLAGNTSTRSRRFTLPQMVFATAASVAVTLSMVLWLNQPPRQTSVSVADIGTRVVHESDSVTPQLTRSLDLDLTENVDFYVWMESQGDLSIEVPRKGT